MKKSISKKILSVVFATMMFSLSACNSNGTASQQSTTTPKAQSNSTSTASNEQGSVSSSKSEPKPSGKKLVVGIQSALQSLSVAYAVEQGYFKDLGLDVELMVFPNGSPQNEGLAAKQLDIASNGLASVFSLANGMTSWIAETDTTDGTCFVFARPDHPVFQHLGEIPEHPDMYGNADILKNQKIIAPANSNSVHVVYAYMDRFGLKAGQDFEFLAMDPSAGTQAFIAGQGDLIGAAGNFVPLLEAAGMKKVATYEDAAGITFLCGILARKDVVETRREDVVLFLRGMYKAADVLMSDEQLRFDYALKFMKENGKEYGEDALKRDIALKKYVTESFMKDPDYIFGDGLIHIGEFFAQVGTIEDKQVDAVKSSIDPSLMKDAFDINLKAFN